MSVPLGNVNRLLPGSEASVAGQRVTRPLPDVQTEDTFASLVSDLISSVNDLQIESARLQDAFLSGDPVELHRVMIKAEEAGLATELLLEIRNRIVNAYNELFRMPM